MLNIDQKYLTNLDESALKKTTDLYADRCCFTAAWRNFLSY